MTIVDELRNDESRVLDRLVDGELSQADRRELLAALDDEPGAWRRTALAFLEAQSWRWQLSRMAAEPLLAQAASRANVGTNKTIRRIPRGTFWSACLAVAASLFVAFGLGTRFPTTSDPTQLAGTAANIASATPAAAVPPIVEAPEAAGPGESSEAVEAPADEPPWETLTLALGDDSGGSNSQNKFQVRARDAADDDPDWLAAGESNLTPAMVEQLEQEGWKVTRERHLLPISLSDGRRMVVPVEQVDLRPPETANF
jgi:hypothetical protein